MPPKQAGSWHLSAGDLQRHVPEIQQQSLYIVARFNTASLLQWCLPSVFGYGGGIRLATIFLYLQNEVRKILGVYKTQGSPDPRRIFYGRVAGFADKADMDAASSLYGVVTSGQAPISNAPTQPGSWLARVCAVHPAWGWMMAYTGRPWQWLVRLYHEPYRKRADTHL